MNKKGFEMAVSTIVLIIIGIAVLIGLILFITKGFGWWKAGIDPIGNAGNVGAVREACGISCRAEDANTFCCEKFKVGGRNVTCLDTSLGVECSLDCSAVQCAA